MGFLHQNLLGHLVKMQSPGSAPAPWKETFRVGELQKAGVLKACHFCF